MIEHIVCSNFCIGVWRGSFCTTLSCSNCVLYSPFAVCQWVINQASVHRFFVSCKSSSKDQSEINLEFWNCLQWYVRKITLVYIKEWAKKILVFNIPKKSKDEFLNNSLLLLAVHLASLAPDLSYSLWLFPHETTQCALTFAKLHKKP